MRIAPSLLFLAAVVTTLTARSARAQGPSPSWARAVDSLVAADMSRAGVPGAQVAVALDGRVIYTKGYGVADIESQRPVTDRTLFQVGSVTKTVTAALLAQLEAEGRVDLQAPITRYVPELAGRRAGAVTTRQLLSHSAGWADATRPFASTDETALGRVLGAISDTIVLTEPGRVYSYSNPGFAMAGYVAERAAKTPFVDLAERDILRRMGMPRATFRPLVAMTYDFTLGHGRAPNGSTVVLRPTPNNAAEYPAGFLYTSAAELARLGIALMSDGKLDGQQVLASSAVRAMTTGYQPIPGAERSWAGYGLDVDTIAGQRVWRKAGQVDGFTSELIMWPDLHLAVVVSINSADRMPVRTDVGVAQLVTGLALAPAAPAAERAATAEEQRQLVGRYRYGPGTTTVEVAEVNGALEWRGTRRTFPLRMLSVNRIARELPGEPPMTLTVTRDAAGRVLFLSAGGRAYVKQP